MNIREIPSIRLLPETKHKVNISLRHHYRQSTSACDLTTDSQHQPATSPPTVNISLRHHHRRSTSACDITNDRQHQRKIVS
ncbi:hypothetical protein LSAT2_016916, partial [Lamellibrachia satsuma]